MPKTATNNYITEAVKLTTTPQFLVRFSWVDSSGIAWPFSRDLSDGTIIGATKNPFKLLNQITGNTQTVEPASGQSSIGQITLSVASKAGGLVETDTDFFLRHMSNPRLTLLSDINDSSTSSIPLNGDISGYPRKGTIMIEDERIRYTSIDEINDEFDGITRGVDGTSGAAHEGTQLIHNGEEIRPNTRVQIFGGYAAIDEADFMSLAVMEVFTRELTPNGLTWKIVLRDLQRFLKRRLFISATQDARVIRTGNPITLALETLMSSDVAGTNHVDYDKGLILASDGITQVAVGAEIPSALIDVAGLELLRETYFPIDSFTFTINRPEDAKAFIEKEFWLALNCIPTITQDGKYGAKRLNAPAPKGFGTGRFGAGLFGESTLVADGFRAGNSSGFGGGSFGQGFFGQDTMDVLTKTDIISWSWGHGDDSIINRVGISYDHEVGLAGFTTRQTYKARASKRKFGERNPIVLESKGIKTTSRGQDIVDERAYYFFKRFSEPPPVLTVTVFFRNNRIELLDVLKVTHTDIPDSASGQRGLIGKSFEVIDITPRWGLQGALTLKLLSIEDFLPTSFQPSDGVLPTKELTLDSTAPAVPTGLTAVPTTIRHPTTGIVVTIIQCTWNANTEPDFARYTLRVLEVDSPFRMTPLDAVGITSTTAQFFGLPADKDYTVEIAGIDGAGNASAFSATVPFTTTDDTTAPAVPTGLACMQEKISNPDGTFIYNISATWDANTETDFDHYRVRLVLPDNVREVAVDTELAKNTWHGLEQGGSYKVRLRAVDIAGNKSASTGDVTCNVGTDTDGPAAPTDLAVSATFRSVIVSVAAPTDTDLASIEVWANNSNNRATATLIGSVKGTPGELAVVIHGDLASGSTRFYWARGVDTSGNGGGAVGNGNWFPTSPTGGTSATTIQAVTADIAVNAIVADRISVSTLSSIVDQAGTIIGGKFQNGGSPTMIIDMDAATITVNKVGGLLIEAADGLHVMSGNGIFFNTTGALGHRIKSGTAGNRLLTIEPVGAITNPQVDIGTYDQVRIILESVGSGFIIRSSSGDMFSCIRSSSATKMGFFGATSITKPSTTADIASVRNALISLGLIS